MQAAMPGFNWYGALPQGIEYMRSRTDPTRRSASWYLHRLPEQTERLVDLSRDPVVSLEIGAMGVVERCVEGRRDIARLAADSLTLTPAHAPCEWQWSGNSFEIFDVYIPHEMLQAAWSDHFSGDPAGLNFAPTLHLKDPGVLFLMKSLYCLAHTERRNTALVYQMATHHLVASLLGLEGTLSTRACGRGGLSASVKRRMLAYIHEHVDDDLSLDDLANVAGLSPYHFLRQFRRSVGETPHRYVVRQRLSRARQLLSQTRLPVVEIALRCGFEDSSHFARRFRAQYRLSPSAFRRDC